MTARVSADDPSLVIHDDGSIASAYAPIVALFEVDGVPYVQARVPGSTRDHVKAIGARLPRQWWAIVKPETSFAIAGPTLRAAGFVRTFSADLVVVVELDDGGFALLLQNGDVVAVAPDGGDRWARTIPHAYLLSRLDHPALPDALIVTCSAHGELVHPFDGRALLTWPEK